MAPVGSGRPRPPPEIVVERYRPGWWSEHEGTRHQQRRIGAGIVRLLGRRLRSGDIPGALDEPAKLGDRHRVRVDEETVDVLLMDRPFFGIELVGTIQNVLPGIHTMFFGAVRRVTEFTLPSFQRSAR